MKKTLIIYRLYDPSYGKGGNKMTLSVVLREDKTLSYAYYGGWQDSGTPFSINNLQLKRSLPIGASQFKTTAELHKEIAAILQTGVGSRCIEKFEIHNCLSKETILNNAPNDRMAEYLAKMDFKLLKEQKTALINIQAKMEKPNPKFTKKEWDVLEGMINFVDSIQDIAVDEYGYKKETVFRITRKDK